MARAAEAPDDIDLANLKAHPFAELYPMIDDVGLDEMAASIKRDGLLDRILLFDGAILDGRNRYEALKRAGIKPVWGLHTGVFNGTEEEAWNLVESKNRHRRHLTLNQRAMLAAKYMERKEPTRSEVRETELEAAEKFDVHDRAIRRARKIRQEMPTHIVEMVERGEVSAQTAERARKVLSTVQLAQVRTPGQLEKKVAQYRHAEVQHLSPATVVDRVSLLIAEMAQREPAQFAGHWQEVETMAQQLMVAAGRVTAAANKLREREEAAA